MKAVYLPLHRTIVVLVCIHDALHHAAFGEVEFYIPSVSNPIVTKKPNIPSMSNLHTEGTNKDRYSIYEKPI